MITDREPNKQQERKNVGGNTAKIDWQGNTPDEDQYLLEINLEDMELGDNRRQEYWLWTIMATRIAK